MTILHARAGENYCSDYLANAKRARRSIAYRENESIIIIISIGGAKRTKSICI